MKSPDLGPNMINAQNRQVNLPLGLDMVCHLAYYQSAIWLY